MRILFFCGVGIQSRNAGTRKKFCDLTFNLFGPKPHKFQDRRAAGGTGVRDFFLKIAIMTEKEPLFLMISQ